MGSTAISRFVDASAEGDRQTKENSTTVPPPPRSTAGIEYKHEDIYDKINNTGCAVQYEALEDCLIQTDKDWRKCQKELYSFKLCCEYKDMAVAYPSKDYKTVTSP